MNFQQVLSGNKNAAYWFNLLPDAEKRTVPPILNQVFATTTHFN